MKPEKAAMSPSMPDESGAAAEEAAGCGVFTAEVVGSGRRGSLAGGGPDQPACVLWAAKLLKGDGRCCGCWPGSGAPAFVAVVEVVAARGAVYSCCRAASQGSAQSDGSSSSSRGNTGSGGEQFTRARVVFDPQYLHRHSPRPGAPHRASPDRTARDRKRIRSQANIVCKTVFARYRLRMVNSTDKTV